jgi:hypothetical protein
MLKFGGGVAAGAVLTPLPWRLLGDSAIWTQNWSWTPVVPRGETTAKHSPCTICPAGCSAEARCVNGVPVGLWPREDALCPAGLVAHHMAFHPLRLRETRHAGKAETIEAALAAAKNAASAGGVAVLDLWPGRTASLLHRMHMQRMGGTYVVPQAIEGATGAAMARLLDAPADAVLHLAGVKTLLSLGTPVLDGWAAPRHAFKARREFHLVQAEARRSRTARLADEWLRITPRGEAALLAGLAGILLRGERVQGLPGLEKLRAMVAAVPLERAAELSGVPAGAMEGLAGKLTTGGPAAVLADGDPAGGPMNEATLALAAALNVVLGTEAFLTRPALPAPESWSGAPVTALSAVPDGAVKLLLVDEPAPGLGLPWALVAPKLAPGATVMALTWNRAAFAARAQWLVPAPAYLEAPMDAPPAHDSADGTLPVSGEMMAGQAGVSFIAAAEFVGRLAGDETPWADRIRERAALFGEKLPDDGAGIRCTVKAVPRPLPKPVRLMPESVTAEGLVRAAAEQAGELEVVAYGWRAAAASPLLAKLWQESDLRDAPNQATAHPSTLASLAVEPGSTAEVQSSCGRCRMRIEADDDAVPGVVEVCGGPAYLQMCEPEAGGTWRANSLKVVKA